MCSILIIVRPVVLLSTVKFYFAQAILFILLLATNFTDLSGESMNRYRRVTFRCFIDSRNENFIVKM